MAALSAWRRRLIGAAAHYPPQGVADAGPVTEDGAVAQRAARIVAAIALVVGMAAASDAGAAGAARTSPPNSGIRGIVLYGPTCPVERPGHTCERPYVANLTFQRAALRGATAHARSGTDGRFSVRLPPGRWLVKVNAGASLYPRASSRVVSVTARHFTRVTIQLDSGIR